MFSMDTIALCNPTNLETKKKKKNDSEKNVEANLCYTRPSPHKKHKSNCITQAHRERIIFSVTTIIRQYTNFPKIL